MAHSKTISAVMWTLLSINILTLVFGSLMAWLGYAIPARLKQFGLAPDIVIGSGFASLLVACIGLCALNYSSAQTLYLYGLFCMIFAILLVIGLPEYIYKSPLKVSNNLNSRHDVQLQSIQSPPNQGLQMASIINQTNTHLSGPILIKDVIYVALIILLFVLIVCSIIFANHLRKRALALIRDNEESVSQRSPIAINSPADNCINSTNLAIRNQLINEHYAKSLMCACQHRLSGVSSSSSQQQQQQHFTDQRDLDQEWIQQRNLYDPLSRATCCCLKAPIFQDRPNLLASKSVNELSSYIDYDNSDYAEAGDRSMTLRPDNMISRQYATCNHPSNLQYKCPIISSKDSNHWACHGQAARNNLISNNQFTRNNETTADFGEPRYSISVSPYTEHSNIRVNGRYRNTESLPHNRQIYRSRSGHSLSTSNNYRTNANVINGLDESYLNDDCPRTLCRIKNHIKQPSNCKQIGSSHNPYKSTFAIRNCRAKKRPQIICDPGNKKRINKPNQVNANSASVMAVTAAAAAALFGGSDLIATNDMYNNQPETIDDAIGIYDYEYDYDVNATITNGTENQLSIPTIGILSDAMADSSRGNFKQSMK